MASSLQLGINSTSDVWKFCQNWTGRVQFGKFPNITSIINPLELYEQHLMITCLLLA